MDMKLSCRYLSSIPNNGTVVECSTFFLEKGLLRRHRV